MSLDKKPIDTSDFHSLKLFTIFQNSNTGTKPLSADLCSLIEVGEKTLSLELPIHSCNINHNVVLSISVSENGQKERKILMVTGKVIQMEEYAVTIEEEEKKVLRVVIDCIQFDEHSWNELIKIYSNRQEAITKFLKDAKGY